MVDSWLRRTEPTPAPVSHPMAQDGLKLHGGRNIVLLAAIVAVILATSAWKPGIALALPGAHLPLQTILRDAALLGIAGLSWVLTPGPVRAGNEFNWHPIAEVGKLFAAIFICVAPVIAMLQAGREGAFAPLVAMVTSASGAPLPQAYYWLTGLLSAFLDNAPTYLVFFELAGGDAQAMMGPLAVTLKAISLGAVFMGALSYIGNAPNMMVAAIAKDMNVPMPGFLGYLVWSFGILVPVLALVGLLFIG
jgi:Na+/H+ antiporter NhaD/arsenite permease-like protein